MRRTRRLGLAALGIAAVLFAVRDLVGSRAMAPDAHGRSRPAQRRAADSEAGGAHARSGAGLSGRGLDRRPTASAAHASETEPGGAQAERSQDIQPPGVAESDPSVAGEAPIRLAIAPPRTGEASVRVVGIDPRAPRPLRLWRVVGDRLAPTALGRSDPSGLVEFPALMLPGEAVELVAVAAGLTPRNPSPGELLEVPPPALFGPAVSMRATDEDGLRLVLQPRHRGGAVLLADSEGRTVASVPVRDRLDSAGRAIELVFETRRVEERPARVAQQLPDGRLTPWMSLEAALLPSQGDSR